MRSEIGKLRLTRCTLWRLWGACLLCHVLSIGLSPEISAADQWSVEGGEVGAKELANRIVKWCKIDGDHVRYTSENIVLKGYQRCGKLESEMRCSPEGKRFIGKADGAPYSYLDCSLGKRIYVKRHDSSPSYPESTENSHKQETKTNTQGLLEQQNFSSGEGVKPMSRAEELKHKEEFKKIQKNQNKKNPYLIFKTLLDPLNNALSGKKPKKGQSRNPAKDVQRELDAYFQELLKGLDPQSKKMAEDLLKRYQMP